VRIGILALQGAYASHARPLAVLGHEAVYVRAAAEFEGIDGLILPGGESSVHLSLIERFGLEGAILAMARAGKPILGTCAGLILLACEVTSPSQQSFGLLDVTVARNAYGRQLASFESVADETRLPLVFIRAPRITRCGAAVEVLATHEGQPIWVRQDNVTGASFHPELTSDVRVHRSVFGDAAVAGLTLRSA
jgi:5'-phosphate synthase pdxT subunit